MHQKAWVGNRSLYQPLVILWQEYQSEQELGSGGF